MSDANKTTKAVPSSPEWQKRMCPFLTMITAARPDEKMAMCVGPACAMFVNDGSRPGEGLCCFAFTPIVIAQGISMFAAAQPDAEQQTKIVSPH